MTIEQLSQRNNSFQQQATQIAELVPDSNLFEFSSLLIRGARMLNIRLVKLLKTRSTVQFYQVMEKLENEMDEMIYVLDKLDVTYRKQRLDAITDFLKKGYELLSVYSLCCDHIIERKLNKDHITNE